MPLKDLGRKEPKIYPSAEEAKAPRVIYREMDLPLDVVEGQNLKVDDDVEVRIVGRVSGMQDTKWNKSISIEMKQGEVTKKENKSVLDQAK